MSWHDADGRVLWSSLPLLGIEQREAIRDALESFSASVRLRVDRNLGDNQTAVLLRAADREGRTVGFAMLLLDSRVLLSRAWRRPAGSGAADRPRVRQAHGRAARPPGTEDLASSLATTRPHNPEELVTALLDAADLEREYAMLRDLNVSRCTFSRCRCAGVNACAASVLLRSKDEGADTNSTPVAILERAPPRRASRYRLDRRVDHAAGRCSSRCPDLARRPEPVLRQPVGDRASADESPEVRRWGAASRGHPASTLAFEIQAEAPPSAAAGDTRRAAAAGAIGCGL